MSHTINYTRRKQTHRKGSALLLSVGLLTMLAMLGTSFLVICRMNRKTSVALTANDPIEPMAAGIVTQVKQLIANDLYMGENHAYEKLGANAAGHYGFIDYPSAGDANSGRDYWLSAVLSKDDKFNTNRHASNILSALAPTAAYNIKENAKEKPGIALENDKKYANWEPMMASDPKGQQYYAAVRVLDTSALANLNTCWRSPQTWGTDGKYPLENSAFFFTPCDINIAGLTNATLLNGRPSKQEFFQYQATHLLTPSNNLLPYGINEESLFRTPSSLAPATGRIATLLGGTTITNREYVTTFNCSRNIIRALQNGHVAIDQRLPVACQLNGTTVKAYNALQTEAERNKVYTLLVNRGLPAHKAAHFVANAWAYSDTSVPATQKQTSKSYAYTKNGNTYFGALPQPVFTEAFAKSQVKAGTLWEVHAVEIYNPTSQTLSNYYVDYAATATTPSGDHPITLTPGQRLIIATKTPSIPANDPFFNKTIIPPVNGTVDFSDGKALRLYRKVGSTYIPVDHISLPNYKRAEATPPATDSAVSQLSRRRDAIKANGRYNIARYVDVDSGNALGVANKLNADQLKNLKNTPTGYQVPELDAQQQIAIAGTGSLLQLFVAGARIEGGQYKSLPETLAAAGANRVARMASESQAVGNSLVPGAIKNTLGEMFTTIPSDTTRSDQPARVYGRININTAPADVLNAMPWLTGSSESFGYTELRDAGTTNNTTLQMEKDAILEQIITNRPYFTPGQVMTAIQAAMDDKGIDKNKSGEYYQILSTIYSRVSDLISVNSDTFAVQIAIQLRKPDGTALTPELEQKKHTYYYLAVLDRSNCVKQGDMPAVLLFTEIPKY